MEGVYYRIRQPQSVPMYDRVTNSYHVLIDDEMIDVPKSLFEKMFEEVKSEDYYVPQTPATDEEIEQIKPMIENLFDKFVGPGKPISVEQVKEMTVGSLMRANYRNEEDMRKLVDEMFEELVN